MLGGVIFIATLSLLILRLCTALPLKCILEMVEKIVVCGGWWLVVVVKYDFSVLLRSKYFSFKLKFGLGQSKQNESLSQGLLKPCHTSWFMAYIEFVSTI